MKKIIIDEEKCIGCGACESFDSNIFELNDEGLATVKNKDFNELSNDEKENAEDAINNCPTSAISIIELEEN